MTIPVGILVLQRHLGRMTASMALGRLATSADSDAEVSIDEATITSAIENMRFPQAKQLWRPDEVTDGRSGCCTFLLCL